MRMHMSPTVNDINSTADSQYIEDNNFEDILAYFRGSDKPSSIFFRQHTWILYIYLGIGIHGVIMNTFLVSLIMFGS